MPGLEPDARVHYGGKACVHVLVHNLTKLEFLHVLCSLLSRHFAGALTGSET